MSDAVAPVWWSKIQAQSAPQDLDDWRALDRLFGALRPRPTRILILGMSPDLVTAWQDFLPRAQFFRLSQTPVGDADRLFDFVGRPGDLTALQPLLIAAGGHQFDAVIDDGAHIVEDVWGIFDSVFDRHLVSGGVYAIQAWAVGYLPKFPEGKRAKLTVRRRAVRLGRHIQSHESGLPGLVKALIDHVPVRDLLASGAELDAIIPIRNIMVFGNVVGVERW